MKQLKFFGNRKERKSNVALPSTSPNR